MASLLYICSLPCPFPLQYPTRYISREQERGATFYKNASKVTFSVLGFFRLSSLVYMFFALPTPATVSAIAASIRCSALVPVAMKARKLVKITSTIFQKELLRARKMRNRFIQRRLSFSLNVRYSTYCTVYSRLVKTVAKLTTICEILTENNSFDG